MTDIKQSVEMEQVIHKRAIPSDLAEVMNLDIASLPEEYVYISTSEKNKGKRNNIFNMNLHYFIRAFTKVNGKLKKVQKTNTKLRKEVKKLRPLLNYRLPL